MEDSSYSVELKLDLELGLSIDGWDTARKLELEQRSRFAKIFTAQDMCSIVTSSSPASSSTSSVCSSSLNKANRTSGTQRHADSVGGDSNGASQSQVVGWPPVRVSRLNSAGKGAKLPATRNSIFDVSKCRNTLVGTSHGGCENSQANLKGKESGRSSLFVKVTMDGIPIGRKINLIAHCSYETLVQTLEDMFQDPTTSIRGFSKYMLTYEDKDGDWMLVGDVPWEMFLSSVKRLRILRSPEPNCHDSFSRGRTG